MSGSPRYFNTRDDATSLKQRFNALAKKLHPDRDGGESKKFQEMKTQYDEACAKTETSDPDRDSGTESTFTIASLIEMVDIAKAASERWPMFKTAAGVIERLLSPDIASKSVTVKPSLEDLLIPNVITVERDGETFCVPAWHDVLVYDDDLVIISEPDLPDGMFIDKLGHLHVWLDITDPEITKAFYDNPDAIPPGATLILRGIGVPMGDDGALYDTSSRGHVCLHG